MFSNEKGVLSASDL